MPPKKNPEETPEQVADRQVTLAQDAYDKTVERLQANYAKLQRALARRRSFGPFEPLSGAEVTALAAGTNAEAPCHWLDEQSQPNTGPGCTHFYDDATFEWSEATPTAPFAELAEREAADQRTTTLGVLAAAGTDVGKPADYAPTSSGPAVVETPYCSDCDHDTHRCGGCGEPVGHGETDCGKRCTETVVQDAAAPPANPFTAPASAVNPFGFPPAPANIPTPAEVDAAAENASRLALARNALQEREHALNNLTQDKRERVQKAMADAAAQAPVTPPANPFAAFQQ